ncbi:unnamed protein product [Cyclocybe aegerita]|uniref:Uncharacterized protein n=1 Tax=Cyclocybe aegerita TaxID=1973307 RepID=A0A8S0XJF4_CYCAE|nr:unnamed protein product [Cyclocybe aegerita]
MVTLEREIEAGGADGTMPNVVVSSPDNEFIQPPTSPQRRSRSPRVVDRSLLSPPVNTWKSRPRHRPTRSQSAPPERRTPLITLDEEPPKFPLPDDDNQPLATIPRIQKRSCTSFTSATKGSTRGGELVRPPPPLLRPTTFWRKTKRSGVTGASYSPSSHLIRRSTYIAAGLTFDAPIHDLSALCVESRIGFIVVPPDQTF